MNPNLVELVKEAFGYDDKTLIADDVAELLEQDLAKMGPHLAKIIAYLRSDRENIALLKEVRAIRDEMTSHEGSEK